MIPTILPFECETYATKEEPFMCMLISIDKKIMYELIDSMSKPKNQTCTNCELGVFSDNVTADIEDMNQKKNQKS